MNITRYVSHLGGKDLLLEESLPLFEQLTSAVDAMPNLAPRVPLNQKAPRGSSFAISPQFLLSHSLKSSLVAAGWQIDIPVTLRIGKRPSFVLDFMKDGIAGDLALGKQAYILSSLYASLPLAFSAYHLKLAIILVPTRDITSNLSPALSSFEITSNLLKEIPLHSVKFPFVILGLSKDPHPLDGFELTSELDRFLVGTLGVTLDEMLLLKEGPSYDFKVALPANDVLAKEACSFGNLSGGGLLIFGIANDGATPGIPSIDVDQIQLRATSTIRARCNPPPTFHFHPFPVPGAPDHSILVVRVLELQTKPCTVDGRVYIRSGPSVQPATPEEIRVLVLG